MADDDALTLARARIGVVLRGKYTLERVLGVGGMASVYEATHRNRKVFAIPSYRAGRASARASSAKATSRTR
jgi:hypothetical protein